MLLPTCPKCKNAGFSIWRYTDSATGTVRLVCCTRCHSIVSVIAPTAESRIDEDIREAARRLGGAGEVV